MRYLAGLKACYWSKKTTAQEFVSVSVEGSEWLQVGPSQPLDKTLTAFC